MRSILMLLLLLTTFNSFAQKIEYSLPAALEHTISHNDYKIIADQSITIISKKYKIDSVKNATIYVRKNGTYILDNLIAECVDEADHTKWQDIIKEHFDALDSPERLKKIDQHNYEVIKPYLSIRIYPDTATNIKERAVHTVSRIDLEGTITMLMLDLPKVFTSVDRDDYTVWHKSMDEVFNAAFENISKQHVNITNEPIGSYSINENFNFLRNDNYAASYALNLQHNAPALVGEWGAVIAMPNKGLVAVCKIDKANPGSFINFIKFAKPFVEQDFNKYPGSISTKFYWYYKNRFTPIVVYTGFNGDTDVITPTGLALLITAQN